MSNIALNRPEGPRAGLKRVLLFLLLLCLSVILTRWLRLPQFDDSSSAVLFLLFFSLGLWISGLIPAFAVSLFIMAFLVFALGNPNFNSHPQDIAPYVNTFSSQVIWILLGGFFLASAMEKTGIDRDFLKLAFMGKDVKPANLLLRIMLITMIASMVMSNTATTAMVLGALNPLLLSMGQKNNLLKAFVLGIPLAAATGGMATLIGSPPNAIAAGALEKMGYQMDFLQWMKVGLPVSIVLTALGYGLLWFKYLRIVPPDLLQMPKDENPDKGKVEPWKKKAVLVILFVTIFLWLTGGWHGISVSGVSALPIVLLPLLGIVGSGDVRSLQWDTLLLVAGGLSLGAALQNTGILSAYTSFWKPDPNGILLILIVFSWITMAFSNIMSNSATTTLMIPLVVGFFPGMSPQIALLIALASSTAMMLPVSTPPNAIAFSTGYIKQEDFRFTGLMMGLIGPAIIALWVLYAF